MPSTPLTVLPVPAPIHDTTFDLLSTILDALTTADIKLQDGDVVALSSKYVAISQGRVVALADVVVSPQAQSLATRYNMDPRIAQLVYEEAEHIFGGISMGFLLTWKNGVISPNAGLDRSNIPSGYVVLLPSHPYPTARAIREGLRQHSGADVGVILTDSWLMPGRIGTTGVAIATAGFRPIQDERGKSDLFGNPMVVTQRGIADGICAAAQLVMGERDEATPIAVVRGATIELTDAVISAEDVAIPWEMCLYVESLTLGLLPDGAPRQSWTIGLTKRDFAAD